MRRNSVWCITSILISILFTSCQFMPEEAVLPEAPVIRSYEVKEYKQDTVTRGNLVLSTTVNCTYIPAKEENLSFSLGDMLIDKVYVSEGQQVRKGELLAELDQENLLEQIAVQEYQLQVLNIKKTHALEQQELETVMLELKKLRAERDGKDLKDQEMESHYARQLQTIEDSIYIEGLRLEEMKADLKARQLYSSIDGTVTYVVEIDEGDRSVKGEKFVTVADMETTVFAVQGTNAQYFEEGTQVTIFCQKKEYPATVVEAEELGLQDIPEDETRIAYLKLTQPDPTLEEGVRGSIELILDQRNHVLYVDKKAVKTSNGEQFVYMLDADGMRAMQPVTTGLENGEFIEITSGLEEGDRIILD